MNINHSLTPSLLAAKLARLWELSGRKILALEKTWDRPTGRRSSPGGKIHGARLDRVDARVSIRLGALAVRRHG